MQFDGSTKYCTCRRTQLPLSRNRDVMAGSFVPRQPFDNILLPVLAVKRCLCGPSDSAFVKATCVDADAVRMRPWNIERLDTAVPAKIMLRSFGIECIRRELVFSANQTKVFFFDDQMQVTRHRAQAAITITQIEFRWRNNFESNPTAMTSAFVNRHLPLNAIYRGPPDFQMCI